MHEYILATALTINLTSFIMQMYCSFQAAQTWAKGHNGITWGPMIIAMFLMAIRRVTASMKMVNMGCTTPLMFIDASLLPFVITVCITVSMHKVMHRMDEVDLGRKDLLRKYKEKADTALLTLQCKHETA